MAVNRLDSAKPGAERKQAEAKSEPSTNGVGQASLAQSGFKAWLPLLVTVVVMPLLAYAMSTLVLLPKLKKALTTAPSEAGAETSKAVEETSATGGSAGSKEKGAGNGKIQATLSKNIMVNVSGSMGTRYLVAGLTLVGSKPDFKDRITRSDDQLRDLASSVLSTKTISDLEKPAARNLIRSEIMSVFNNALGAGVIQEIYITEFAIQ
jgi:flagellar FliL protein